MCNKSEFSVKNNTISAYENVPKFCHKDNHGIEAQEVPWCQCSY